MMMYTGKKYLPRDGLYNTRARECATRDKYIARLLLATGWVAWIYTGVCILLSMLGPR